MTLPRQRDRRKLTADQVREIRRLYKPRSRDYNVRALAKMFSVSVPVIIRVYKGRCYKEVK